MKISEAAKRRMQAGIAVAAFGLAVYILMAATGFLLVGRSARAAITGSAYIPLLAGLIGGATREAVQWQLGRRVNVQGALLVAVPGLFASTVIFIVIFKA